MTLEHSSVLPSSLSSRPSPGAEQRAVGSDRYCLRRPGGCRLIVKLCGYVDDFRNHAWCRSDGASLSHPSSSPGRRGCIPGLARLADSHDAHREGRTTTERTARKQGSVGARCSSGSIRRLGFCTGVISTYRSPDPDGLVQAITFAVVFFFFGTAGSFRGFRVVGAQVSAPSSLGSCVRSLWHLLVASMIPIVLAKLVS